MISSVQLRMARAALDLTTRQLGEALGVSAQAISRYENGDRTVIGVPTAERMLRWFTDQRVYFGPADGVCVRQNVFAQERWWGLSCYQLLKEHGILPTSGNLIAAYGRVSGEAHADNAS